MEYTYIKTFEKFNNDDEPKTFSIYFVAWFTGTVLCNVKHPEFGKHQLTPEQVKYSSGEYKTKIYKNIEKAIKNGDITDTEIEKHSKRPQSIKESKDCVDSETYYVKYSSWFDNHDYDITKIKKAIKNGGGEKIRTSKAFGWKNQPDVVVFCANDDTLKLILKEIKKELDTEHIIILKKDW